MSETKATNERNVEALAVAMRAWFDTGRSGMGCECDPDEVAVFLASRGVLVPHVLVSADLFRLSARFKDHDMDGTGTLRAINGEGVRLTLERIAKGEP